MHDLKIPLFPLNGVIFFPNTNLPLNIFEERYLDMINHSLKSNRLIGMIQVNKKGDFYSIGCVGKINSFSETDDGRYIINLIGQNYFKINKRLPDTFKFVMAKVDIVIKNDETAKKNLKSFNKKLLLEKYKEFVYGQGIEIDLSAIHQIDDEDLIKFVAMSCPFSTEDKQMLLETFDLTDLNNKLINLFDFYQNLKSKKSLN